MVSNGKNAREMSSMLQHVTAFLTNTPQPMKLKVDGEVLIQAREKILEGKEDVELSG